MIRKEKSEQKLYHSRVEKPKIDRVSETTEDKSEDELYGLALILRNTEDVAANKRDNLYNWSDQPNHEQSSKEDVTPVPSDKEDKDKLNSRCFPNLNRRLVIYKSFYFFFFSALGSLFPYLAVFYKQLWLSAHETGLLIGIGPLIQLFVTPMWGVIADAYKKNKLIFIMSLVSWLVSNYSLSLISPVFHLGNCKDNGTIGIIQEILKNKTKPIKNSTSTTHQKQKKPISVNSGNSRQHWFQIVGSVKLSNSSKQTAINPPKQKGQNQLKLFYPVEDNQTVFHNAWNLVYNNHSLSTHSATASTRRLRRNIDNSALSMSDRKQVIKTKLNFKTSKLNHKKLRRLDTNNKAIISKTDSLKRFQNSSDVEELSSQVNRERIERVFDFLNMAGEYPWPLDTVANYELTQTSHDWKTPTDKHLFTILLVITAIGALIAAPAITLADTATLQNLGKCFPMYHVV